MNSTFNFSDATIAVTGGAGFLGGHVVQALTRVGAKKVHIIRSAEHDLRDPKACALALSGADAVIHLAATVGGIGFNQLHPAELFYDNMLMGLNVIHESWKLGVQKVLALGTICAYPKFTPVPFQESSLWDGYPEETNAPYGLAKKMLLVQAQAYREQYGFNTVYVLPTNLYGPGDKFDPAVSHVIPALIRKFVEAKESEAKEVELWGSGKATREFLFVEDAADGIVQALERYNGADPVNLGSQEEISIRSLAELIQGLVGYTGSLRWNTSKPDGQPRRKVDASRARELFGFEAKTTFDDGLKRTLEWFMRNRSA